MTKTSLRDPPDDLAGFPYRRLEPSRTLWRIHRAENDPRWFCSDMACRFDLAAPAGTLHLAEQPLGSFMEVFRDVRLIADVDIHVRRLSSLRAPRSLRLADCTSQRARAFGVTGEIHTTEDYERTQGWAAALSRAGYDGIRYYLRHDPSLRLAGVAVFGPTAASRRWRKPRSGLIDEHVLLQARRRFGIRALPVP